jgi:cytochrome P450
VIASPQARASRTDDGLAITLPRGPDLPASVQTVLYHRDPLGVSRRARDRYGPVFTLTSSLKGPLVFVAEPDAVQPLLRADPVSARAGAARRRILPQASSRSPFGADGDRHRAIREAVEPAFAPEVIAAARDEIARIAAAHVAGWPIELPFRLLPRLRTLATDVFVGVVLRVEAPRRRSALVAAIRRMLWTPGNPPLSPPAPDEGPLGPVVDRAFRRRTAAVARLLEAELVSRREPGDDLLGRVVAATSSVADAVDALLVVIAAAQEPPSIALTNVLYELARRPDWRERYLTDVQEREAIVAEALRLRPAVQAVLRELTAPVDVGGHRLQEGTLVALPAPLLQRDRAAFPAPDDFRPGRFAAGVPAGAPYFPFGGGVRRCVGEPLARMELTEILPSVLSRLRLRPAWPTPERMVVRATVLVPHRSGLMIAARR